MRIDGYSLISEFFNTRKDEEVLKSYPIMNLSIYRGDELVTRRYLTARLSVTNRKLVIDRLSTVNPLPVLLDKESLPHTLFKILWKPMRAFEIPYIYLTSIQYDKKTKSLVVDTLKERIMVFMKFMNTQKVSNEVVDLVDKIFEGN